MLLRALPLILVLISFLNCQILQIEARYPITVPPSQLLVVGEDNSCGLSMMKPIPMTEIAGSDLYRLTLNCSRTTEKHVVSFRVFKVVDGQEFYGSLERKLYKVQMNYPEPTKKIVIAPFFDYLKPGKLLNVGQVPYSKRSVMKEVSVYLPPNFIENTAQKFNHFAIVNDGQELFQYVPHFERSVISSEIDNNIIFISVSQKYFTQERYIEFSKVPCNASTCPGICGQFEDFKNLGGGLDDYLDWIEGFLVQYVMNIPELNGRIDKTKPFKFSMYGTSFGGYAAGNACYFRPQTYKACSAQSANWNWNCESFVKYVQANPLPKNIKNGGVPRFFIDYGSYEYPQTGCLEVEAQRVVDALRAQNIPTEFEVQAGGVHTQQDWGFRLPNALRFLEKMPEFVETQ